MSIKIALLLALIILISLTLGFIIWGKSLKVNITNPTEQKPTTIKGKTEPLTWPLNKDPENSISKSSTLNESKLLVNANTYKSLTLGFEIKYPEGYGIDTSLDRSISISKAMHKPSAGPSNSIYITVIPKYAETIPGSALNYSKESLAKLINLPPGQSISIADITSQAEFYTYKRELDITYNAINFKVFTNQKPWEHPTNTIETRYIGENEDRIFILGTYLGSNIEDQYYISKNDAAEIIRSLSIGYIQNNKANLIGFIKGKLCYPSSFIPKGVIEAKNLDTLKVVSMPYTGIENAKTTIYELGLEAGKYSLRFIPDVSVSKIKGYRTKECKNANEDTCSPENIRTLDEVIVSPNMTKTDFNICDYYYQSEPVW